MCGITGWVDWQRDLRAEQATAAAMTDTMACRGPDARGVWSSRHAILGHRRLAVIDLEGGAQPMRAEPAVLTYSGELYNFRELRAELAAAGHEFRTRSDTEVVLHAYLEWGAACVERFNGMFAFAIWDERTEELLLVRDRLGIKPLFYAEVPGGVLFGSEPKALLANPLFRPVVDTDGLAELFGAAGTKTPGHGVYKGCKQVRPGCFVRATRDGIREARYWSLESKPHTDSLADTVQRVRELLNDIVERQLISDVPLCSLLSGGLDSSLLTALAARALAAQGQGPVRTFSIDYPDSETKFKPDPWRPSLDEPFVQMVARHVGSEHTTIVTDNAALLANADLPLSAHDVPGWGDMEITLYLLFKGVREHSTVALSGESADEVFGGYGYFRDEARLAANTFPWMHGQVLPDVVLRPEIAAKVKPVEYRAQRYAEALAEVPRLAGESPRDARLREVFHLAHMRWLPGLLDRKDRMSMAVGLEVRVPFCDHRLVEYLWNVPWAMKSTDGIEKGLLRRAVEDLLPHEVAWRPKSSYPAIQDNSYDRLIRDQLYTLLADRAAPLWELVEPAVLRDALDGKRPVPVVSCVPSITGGLAYLLDMDKWIRRYGVDIQP